MTTTPGDAPDTPEALCGWPGQIEIRAAGRNRSAASPATPCRDAAPAVAADRA